MNQNSQVERIKKTAGEKVTITVGHGTLILGMILIHKKIVKKCPKVEDA